MHLENQKKILIMEDDKTLSSGIAIALRQDNYQFTQSHTIASTKEILKHNTFDLLILDVNLPDGNGFDLCQEIRKTSKIPIIMLTINDMETDIVAGFELGADDYITKPFSLMILRARVNALLRRLEGAAASLPGFYSEPFYFDFVKMIFKKNNIKIELSKTEQRLLRLLVENKNMALTRSYLLETVWADDFEYVDENALSVTVKRLRDKIEKDPSKPEYLKTVYGIGYIWETME